jgi:hypothetical protein
MGGSSKPPGPSDEQRKNEREMLELQKKTFEASQKPIKLPDIAPVKPLPPPPPPAQQSSGEVAQQAEEEKRKAARRTNTGRSTIFAGETGAYKQSLGGSKTLLG